MNQMINNITTQLKNKLNKDQDPLIKTLLKLPQISDSSYMIDNTAFEFLTIYREIKYKYPDLIKSINLNTFNESNFKKLINENNDYKLKRIQDKIKLIQLNVKIFGKDNYIKTKYSEKSKLTDTYSIEEYNDFYQKKINWQKIY